MTYQIKIKRNKIKLNKVNRIPMSVIQSKIPPKTTEVNKLSIELLKLYSTWTHPCRKTRSVICIAWHANEQPMKKNNLV